MLNVGFAAGLFLSFVCFLASAYYLYEFQHAASQSVATALASAKNSDLSASDTSLVRFSLTAHIFVAQVLLRSCGVFAGLAFGFLGFSLFLIGVQGSIDAEGDLSGKIKLSLLRISPGALVIVAATVLIGVCAASSLPGSLAQTQTTTMTSQDPSDQIEAPSLEDITADDVPGFDEINQ